MNMIISSYRYAQTAGGKSIFQLAVKTAQANDSLIKKLRNDSYKIYKVGDFDDSARLA